MHSFAAFLMIMFQWIAFLGIIIGIIGITRFIIRNKNQKTVLLSITKKIKFRNFSILIVSVIIFLGSLFWLINFHTFENDYPTLKLAILNEGFKNIQEINTNVSSVPIILCEGKHDSLFVFTYKTTKTTFGLKKYFINCVVWFILDPLDYKYSFFPAPLDVSFPSIPVPNKIDDIDESSIFDILYFPDIWFGLIYPENRNKIRINGQVPYFYDIQFNGLDYVFWYIEKDAPEAELVFIEP